MNTTITIETLLNKTNYDLRVYSNGTNVIEAWYQSNGKQIMFPNKEGKNVNSGGNLSENDLKEILCHSKTKQQFKENIGKENESMLYIGR